MPMSQLHVSPSTPMGANLVPGGGATFRVWDPDALEVHAIGDFNTWSPDDSSRLVRQADGRWTGFAASARDGDEYLYYVKGRGSEGRKRDPYARELTVSPEWPQCHCILRDPGAYPWHDGAYRTPDFHNLVIYQLHVGCFSGPDREHRAATFLDVVRRIEHLAGLGVTAIQLLPVVEFQTMFSMGYNGTDYFSPEMDYGVADEALDPYQADVNRMLERAGHPPLAREQARGATNQLRILVDLGHLHGLAVILDVVYNHAGGDFGGGPEDVRNESIYFHDRQPGGDQNRSLYFTDQGWAGGLVFAFWKEEVRQFLIDNAVCCLTELHVDGLRFDEVSVIDGQSKPHGWRLCQDLTDTARAVKPQALLNAEYWPVNPAVVRPRGEGGAGFDATQHDGLRNAIRAALRQASGGGGARVDMDAIAASLWPPGFPRAWQAVTCVENHDRVYRDREDRLPRLADGGDPRSWYARSRSRVATALILAAPGIPMLFMGQELLEDKRWSDSREPGFLLWWGGLDGGDGTVLDHLRFTQEAVRLRHRLPALRRGSVNPFHVHNDNRVLAFHRWIEGEGEDVVVVASLSDVTYYGYRLGFPREGRWAEVFNSDVYDHYVNPRCAGNGGAISAGRDPLHGLPCSAAIVVPANAVLVFRYEGAS